MARTPNLHKAHAAANAVGQDAVSMFHTIAADLRKSAEAHRAVVSEATGRILELQELRDSAVSAAQLADKQAAAIRGLLGATE